MTTTDRRRLIGGGLAAASGLGLLDRARAEALPGMVGAVSPWPKLTAFYDSHEVGPEAFANWSDGLVSATRGLAGLRSLTLNRVDPVRTAKWPYDAVLELVFSDNASLARARADVHADLVLTTTAVTIRTPDHRAGRAGAKRIGLVGRAQGAAQAGFFKDWRDVHAIAVDKQPGLTGYQLNLAPESAQAAPTWDGYAELWWPDWSTYEAATRVRLQQPSTSDFFARRLLLLVEEQTHMEMT